MQSYKVYTEVNLIMSTLFKARVCLAPIGNIKHKTKLVEIHTALENSSNVKQACTMYHMHIYSIPPMPYAVMKCTYVHNVIVAECMYKAYMYVHVRVHVQDSKYKHSKIKLHS